jgi:hypothetical protein
MGFELSVIGRDATPSLVRRWQASLAAHGLLCEFHPDFEFGAGHSGFLPIKLTVAPGSFPLADRYGTEPVLCGFEFSDRPYSYTFYPDEPARPPELVERLRQAVWLYHFWTGAGRTVADLRLQCFGAATLAELVGGVVDDPQQGLYFFGPSAVANAAREANEYEADWAQPQQWQLPKFADEGLHTEEGDNA